jgi:hypothetical protein
MVFDKSCSRECLLRCGCSKQDVLTEIDRDAVVTMGLF